MKFPSRKNLVIVGSIILAVLIGLGVWFFAFRTVDSVNPSGEDSGDIAAVEEKPDQIRIRHLNLIKQYLQAALQRGVELPLPEDTLEITFGDIPLGFKGRVPASLYDAIGLNILLDPKTGESYFYALSPDKKTFEVMAFLDSGDFSQTTLGNMPVYSAGTATSELFLVDASNIPLVMKKLKPGKLDISDLDVRKTIGLETLKSCLDIYNINNSIIQQRSGVYTIDVNGKKTQVFCDMQTDGGGWTLFYANNGHLDSPIKKSYVEMREGMVGEPILDFSSYDDPNLAGLLDYRHFIDLGSKEVLIRNQAGERKKWVKFSFSTSKTLEWALGPLVLGKTDYGCIGLPKNATWSILNESKSISRINLVQIMNHGGTSWGISHENYPCNDYTIRVNPHIAFYNAFSNKDDSRARLSDELGNGKENEYRYFIR